MTYVEVFLCFLGGFLLDKQRRRASKQGRDTLRCCLVSWFPRPYGPPKQKKGGKDEINGSCHINSLSSSSSSFFFFNSFSFFFFLPGFIIKNGVVLHCNAAFKR